MADSTGVDRVEIVGVTRRGLRARQNPLAAFGVPVACPARFLVLRIEDDGGQVTMWNGVSYGRAIFEAERCAVNWSVLVMDRVV